MHTSSCFDRWEKDPFFSAAEEVQESADRMESIYRRWMKVRSNGEVVREDGDAVEIRRELHTALGTAKWQLEEFDRASRTRGEGLPPEDDAKTRHAAFVSAIRAQVRAVEDSLRESEMEEGRSGLSWVRLDQGERDELAAFLSGSPAPLEEQKALALSDEELRCREDFARITHFRLVGERVPAHRRAASAGNDDVMFTIPLSNENSPRGSADDMPHPRMPKVFSLSRLAVVESTSKMKTCLKKWKHADRQRDSETIPLQDQQAKRELAFFDSCHDESYDKQLYGWIGIVQRQLQRSQYQIQYGRFFQVIFWSVVALLLLVLFVLRAV